LNKTKFENIRAFTLIAFQINSCKTRTGRQTDAVATDPVEMFNDVGSGGGSLTIAEIPTGGNTLSKTIQISTTTVPAGGSN
jgi:hypothetical protein